MDENKDKLKQDDSVMMLYVEEGQNGMTIEIWDSCEKMVVEEKASDTERNKVKLALGNILLKEITHYVDEFCSSEIGMRIKFFEPEK